MADLTPAMHPTEADPQQPDADRPAVRGLDVQRVDDGIVLTDRLGISEPVWVPTDLLPIVGRCDGTHTLAQIRQAVRRQLGSDLPADFIADLVQKLDARLLLVGPRFDAAATAAANAFLAAANRSARHAGSAGYPAEPATLAPALDELLGLDTMPPPAPAVRGLVAPHIDLARGSAGYRAAYRRLLAAPVADLYVVFGTGHAGPPAPVTGMPLDWSTPLGIAPTERSFVDTVHAAVGAADPIASLMHRDEHSLEFQVLFLQHLHARRDAPPPRIAGFLCGALPSTAGDPLQEPWCQDLLSAFRRAEAAVRGRVCYVAGADLAHIGPLFGDAEPVSEARLRRLDTADRSHLARLQRGAPGPFHRAIEHLGNPDRICSAPAITLCAALAGGAGELLHYGQARATDGSQTVSFAALGFVGAVSA